MPAPYPTMRFGLVAGVLIGVDTWGIRGMHGAGQHPCRWDLTRCYTENIIGEGIDCHRIFILLTCKFDHTLVPCMV